MKKQNVKKLKGQGPLLKSLVNRNIGSRTGRDVKAGKKISKDKDGYENFDDYWSESDADLTSNTTFHSVSSRLSTNYEKENVSSLVTCSQPASSRIGQYTSNFSSASCSQPVGAAACYLGYLTVGSRTGQNVIAGKNIRKHDDGFDNFDTYWSESEPDSMLSFHKSVHINESKSFISAGIQKEEEEETENEKYEDKIYEIDGDSDSEVIINTRRSTRTHDTVNTSQTQTADSESRHTHSNSNISVLEDRSSVGDVSHTGVEDPDSVCDDLDEDEGLSLKLDEEGRESEDGVETESVAAREDVTDTEARQRSPDQDEGQSLGTPSETAEHTAESACSEEETGALVRRLGSISVYKHGHQEEEREEEMLQKCPAEDKIDKTKSEDFDETKNSVDISDVSNLNESKGPRRRPQRKSRASENTTENEPVKITGGRTRSRSRGSVGNVSNQNDKDASVHSWGQSSKSLRTKQRSVGDKSIQDKSLAVADTSIQKQQSGRKSGRRNNKNKSILDQEGDSSDLTSAREMNVSLNKSKGGKKEGKSALSRKSINSDIEDLSVDSAVESGKKQMKVSQRKPSDNRECVDSHVQYDSEHSVKKSDKKGTKVSQRRSSASRKSFNSDVEPDSDSVAVMTKSGKKGTKVSQRKSSEKRDSINSHVEYDSEGSGFVTNSDKKATKVSRRSSESRKFINSDLEPDSDSAAVMTKSDKKGTKVSQRSSESRKSINSDLEPDSDSAAVMTKSDKKGTKVSQRSSESRKFINSDLEPDSDSAAVMTKSDKKGTKVSQRSSKSRKSINSDLEPDSEGSGFVTKSDKKGTKVPQRKSSESRKSDVEKSPVEPKSLKSQTKLSQRKPSESRKSVNSEAGDVSGSAAPEIKSLQKTAIIRQRKSSVSKSVNSDVETEPVQKQTKSSQKSVRKSSKIADNEEDDSVSASKPATKEASDTEDLHDVEDDRSKDDITDFQKPLVPLKVVKSNRKSLKTHQNQKQQAKEKSLVNESTANESLHENSDRDESSSSSQPEVEGEEDDVAVEANEGGASLSNIVADSSVHESREQTEESNESVTAHSKVVKLDNIREVTPSDLIISAPVGNITAASRLNLGGDVTGSISKNIDGTTKTVSNTPMHSFRTKKRLSYSKLFDDSIEKGKESNSSGAGGSEERSSSRHVTLESLVEEEEETEGNCDFLSLRTSHRDTLKTTDTDSVDDSFWMVDDENPKKGKAAKRASKTGNAKGFGKGGNEKEGSGKDEEESREGKEGKKKAAGEKRGRKKGQKKNEDEGSPEKHSRKSSDVETDVHEPVQTKASVKQRKRGKSSGVTRTPSSTKLKRSSTDTLNNTRGGKRSRSARVTKTKEMMETDKRNPESPTDTQPVARGRLSHLHLAGVGESPQSGVSFRQRRRRTLSDSGKPLLNTSCPVELSFSPAVADDDAQPTESSRRESLTPSSPISNLLPLTPCLVPQGTVKSVEKKKRRVTISNIVEKASVSYTDSSVSDPGKMTPGNCSANVSTTSCGDITGSPIHFFEVTNTEAPDPITAPPKTKIIYPKPGPDGLRRSQRVRVRPVEWYKNEHIIYENKAGDFVIAGIQPSREAEYLAAEMEKKKRRVQSKLKQPKKAGMSRQKLLERQNLSMHQEPPPELDYTVSTEMPVINPNTNHEVLIDCVAASDNATYVGPKGTGPKQEDPYIISHTLQQPRFTSGHVLIAPLKEKSRQLLTDNTLIFTIIHGKLSVTIHRGSSILEAGDQFFVPRGNSYSITNLRNEEAKLSFVNLLEGEN